MKGLIQQVDGRMLGVALSMVKGKYFLIKIVIFKLCFLYISCIVMT